MMKKCTVMSQKQKVTNLPPGDFGSSRELTRGEGPTPVDHTNSPYGTSVPSLRINF
jgi:hypothetical protein